MDLPTTAVPRPLRPLVGPVVHLEDRRCWSPPDPAQPERQVADLTVVATAGPHRGELRGQLLVGPGTEADSTLLEVQAELTVAVPLLGGRLSGPLMDLLRGALDHQAEALGDWLAPSGSPAP